MKLCLIASLIYSETTQLLSLYFVRKEGEAVSTGVREKSIRSHGLLNPVEPWRLGSEILPKVSKGIDFPSHTEEIWHKEWRLNLDWKQVWFETMPLENWWLFFFFKKIKWGNPMRIWTIYFSHIFFLNSLIFFIPLGKKNWSFDQHLIYNSDPVISLWNTSVVQYKTVSLINLQPRRQYSFSF